MSFKKYPIVFEPILKDRIWGGTKLNSVLGKNLKTEQVGESWEISLVPDNISTVANGCYKGLNLEELLSKYPVEILGESVYRIFGKQFPLLFKFLDAKEDLSIQLHPNDELARKRHDSFGKTEMWYVMQANPGARIVVDFKEGVSEEDYLKHMEAKSLPSILNEIPVKEGDVFFIETGTVHAIGAGVLLAEIQQASDITYRVYDWDRLDSDGNSRELHISQALEAINYSPKNVELHYEKELNKGNLVVDCPFFTVNYVPLSGVYIPSKKHDTFYLYVCTEGACTITLLEENEGFSFKKGDTILMPASLNQYMIQGEATLLEIFIS